MWPLVLAFCRERTCVSACGPSFAAEGSASVLLALTSIHSHSVLLQSDRRQSGPAAAEEACGCLLTLQEIDSF